MKSKATSITFALVMSLSFGFLQSAQAAPVAEGAKCLKLNAAVKSGNLTLKCIKSGKKLILVAKFKNCTEVKSLNRAPIVRETDPLLYLNNKGLDRDGDGIACNK